MARITLLICDDAVMYSRMLSAALNGDTAIEVVGTASDVDETLRLAGELQPDVVLLDHLMDDADSSVLAPRLRERTPGSTIVLISGAMDDALARAAEAAGADGWVAKATSPEQMRERVLAIHARSADGSRR